MSALGISHAISIDALDAAVDPVGLIVGPIRALLDTLVDGGGKVSTLQLHTTASEREITIYATTDLR